MISLFIVDDQQRRNASVNYLTKGIMCGKFWVLRRPYIMVHRVIKDVTVLDNIPESDRIEISDRIHILRDERAAVALRLVL